MTEMMARNEALNLIVDAIRNERADTLAFLRKRQRAAKTMLSRSPEEQAKAEIIYQQIGIEIEAIEQGLHVGDAACEVFLPSADAETARPG